MSHYYYNIVIPNPFLFVHQRYSRRRSKHLLLDPLHVHSGWRGKPRCLPWCKGCHCWTTTPLRKVLSVGRIHPVLSGQSVNVLVLNEEYFFQQVIIFFRVDSWVIIIRPYYELRICQQGTKNFIDNFLQIKSWIVVVVVRVLTELLHSLCCRDHYSNFN